jgi:hypothetical protein
MPGTRSISGWRRTPKRIRFTWKDPKTGEDGQTIWSLFKESSKYFDPSTSQVMINYRVADMDSLLKALESEGVKVLDRQDAEYGHFAWIMDPEGNKIELWQPLSASCTCVCTRH